MVSGRFVCLRITDRFYVRHNVNRCREVVVEGVLDFVGDVVAFGDGDGGVDSDRHCDAELMTVPPRSEFC